jgi:surface antigen
LRIAPFRGYRVLGGGNWPPRPDIALPTCLRPARSRLDRRLPGGRYRYWTGARHTCSNDQEQKLKTMHTSLMIGGYLLTGAVAQAQGTGVSRWYPSNPLTTEDREIISRTAQEQIHGKPPNTVATWTNPANGRTGTIKLLSKSTRQGMPCERIEYRTVEAQSGQQQGRYVLTSCRLPDGSWKFAE